MTQHTKKGSDLWYVADNGILAGGGWEYCGNVLLADKFKRKLAWVGGLWEEAGQAGWSVEESWADLVWSDEAGLF